MESLARFIKEVADLGQFGCTMNEPLKNELLSAYLDGELTAAEHAEVEHFLAANPEARKLLDELRTLRSALQSLPQVQLAEDLTPAVLHEAEKRMLGVSEQAKARPAPFRLARLLEIIWEHMPGSRAIAWATTALAIGLLIMLYEKQQATQPRDGGLQKEIALTQPPSEKARLTEEKAMQAKEDFSEMPYSPPTIQARPEPQEPSEIKSQAMDSLAGKTPRTPAAPAGVPLGASESLLAAGEQPAMKAVPPQPAMNAEIAKDDLKRRSRLGPVLTDRSVLVVHCDLTAAAVQQRAFDKLLEANGIAWQPSAEDIAGDKPAEKEQLDQGRRFGHRHRQTQQPRAKAAATQQPAVGEVELVYVEASPAQIEETLAALAARPELFVALAIKPSEHRLAQKALTLQRAQMHTGRTGPEAADGFTRRPARSGTGITGTSGGRGVASEMSERGGSVASQPPLPRSERAAQSAPTFSGQAQRIPLPPAAEQEALERAGESFVEAEGSSAKGEVAEEARQLPQERAEGKLAKEPAKEEHLPPAQPEPDGAAPAVQRQRVLFVLRFVNGRWPAEAQ